MSLTASHVAHPRSIRALNTDSSMRSAFFAVGYPRLQLLTPRAKYEVVNFTRHARVTLACLRAPISYETSVPKETLERTTNSCKRRRRGSEGARAFRVHPRGLRSQHRTFDIVYLCKPPRVPSSQKTGHVNREGCRVVWCDAQFRQERQE